MKKIFLLTFLAACFFQEYSLSAQPSGKFSDFNYSIDDQIDSIITTDNQGVRNKYIYAYNENRKIVFVKLKYGTDGGWRDYRRYTYTYDGSGNLTTIFIEAYDMFSDVWLNWELFTYTYDGGGKLLESFDQYYESNGMRDYSRKTYAYDASGNIASLLWELSNPTFENYRFYLFAYDSNNNLLDKITQFWNSGDWGNWRRDSCHYNGEGKLDVKHTLTWSGSDSSWIHYKKTNYEYNGSGGVTSALVKWRDDFNQVWVNDTLHTYNYNSENLPVGGATQIWNGAEWKDYTRFTTEYNADGNISTNLFEFWLDGEWFTDVQNYKFYDYYGNLFSFRTGKIEVYYGVPVGIGEKKSAPDNFILYQNYPNPFNPTTVVSYSLPTESRVKIEITNMLGQSVGVLVDGNKSAGYYETVWNAGNLSSGIYFINIKAAGINSKKTFRQVKKALLLK